MPATFSIKADSSLAVVTDDCRHGSLSAVLTTLSSRPAVWRCRVRADGGPTALRTRSSVLTACRGGPLLSTRRPCTWSGQSTEWTYSLRQSVGQRTLRGGRTQRTNRQQPIMTVPPSCLSRTARPLHRAGHLSGAGSQDCGCPSRSLRGPRSSTARRFGSMRSAGPRSRLRRRAVRRPRHHQGLWHVR